jgi:hypothetical protein
VALSGNYSGGDSYSSMYLPVSLRSTSVTLTVSSVSHFKTEQLNGGTQTATSLTLNAISKTTIAIKVTVGGTLSNPVNLLTDNVDAKLILSAEL